MLERVLCGLFEFLIKIDSIKSIQSSVDTKVDVVTDNEFITMAYCFQYYLPIIGLLFTYYGFF